MTGKVDQAVGLVTLSLGGVTATLAPHDAAAWGTVLMDLAPLMLIAFLIWRVQKMDKQLSSCRKQHDMVTEQLLLAYTALTDRSVRQNLPTKEDFLSGQFTIQQIINQKESK